MNTDGAPDRYSLQGKGSGGAAGHKGGADVTLEEDGGQTILRYTAKAEIVVKLHNWEAD